MNKSIADSFDKQWNPALFFKILFQLPEGIDLRSQY